MSQEPLASDQVPINSLAGFNKQALGVPQTLVTTVTCNYTTSSGDSLHEKILVGSKPILFPTACSENCCFEYRFSIRDLILPSELPEVTGIYFKDIVVKIQDMFTQTTCSEAIAGGYVYSYMPFCTVLTQDQDGIETEDHTVNGKTYKFLRSDRLIQRESCPIYSVNSNLKIEKSISLEDQSNTYKLLAVKVVYDEKGDPVRKFLESIKSVSQSEYKEIQECTYSDVEARKGKTICVDVILCDIVVFCKRTFDFTLPFDEKVNTLKEREKGSVPIGWMTPEEKLQKFGKKGTYMADYTTRKLPNNLFFYVDMTNRSEQMIASARPYQTVFTDNDRLICPYVNQYAYASQIFNIRVFSK